MTVQDAYLAGILTTLAVAGIISAAISLLVMAAFAFRRRAVAPASDIHAARVLDADLGDQGAWYILDPTGQPIGAILERRPPRSGSAPTYVAYLGAGHFTHIEDARHVHVLGKHTTVPAALDAARRALN